MRNKRLIILAMMLVIVSIAAGLIIRQGRQTSIVHVVINAPDGYNMTVKLDGTLVSSAVPDTYLQAKPGNHSLVITKAGYAPFSTGFSVIRSTPITINAVLQRTSTPTLPSLKSVSQTNIDAAWTLNTVQYFGDHGWAFAQCLAKSDGNAGFFILRFDDKKQAWQNVYGPATTIDDATLNTLPNDLQKYLQDNYYTTVGDS